MSMYLEIGVADVKYSPRSYVNTKTFGFADLDERIRVEIEIDFTKYLARQLKKELILAIKKQRYSSSWSPLTTGYLEFKKRHGLSENIWEATGTLVNSIVYRRRGNKYFIGILNSAKYPNGVSVNKVARAMEYGTKSMPARPLFRPVVKSFKRRISKYWLDYLHWRFPKRGW